MARGRICQRNKVWYVDFCANGRRHRFAAGTNKNLAEDVLQKKIAEVIEGKFLDRKPQSRKISFAELCRIFLERYSKINKGSYKTDLGRAKKLTEILGGYNL